MSTLRARMKQGFRPIILRGGVWQVPEYPTYWEVPVQDAAAVANHVAAGEIEYEPALSRSAGGQFAVAPALQTVQREPDRGRFQRKGGR